MLAGDLSFEARVANHAVEPVVVAIVQVARTSVGITGAPPGEQHLADIREIMISKEAKLNKLKAKRVKIENNLPSLFAKAALGEIPSANLEQAKKELKDLKR